MSGAGSTDLRCEFVVLTIFPQLFPGPLGAGVSGRALERGLINIDAVDLRDFADPPHRQVDDEPFGGGAGMVFKPEPLFRAIRAIKRQKPGVRSVLLDPAGRRFDQPFARDLAQTGRILLICGRYEGIDERVRRELIDDELSIGDYVLSGGELAAMVAIDAVARLIPGVVQKAASVEAESFESGGLDYPHYTRPAVFEGHAVPEVLLSGHHERIAQWRKQAARERTRRRRPDLLEKQDAGDSSKDRIDQRTGNRS